VSATCPAGHVSATTDYCDQCGARIDAAAAPAETGTSAATSASPVTAPCPQCGAARSGHDRFCEDCGFDFSAPAPPSRDGVAPAWAARVAPDREQFARVAPEGLAFPDAEPERTIALDVARVRIGRRRSAGEQTPEIAVGDPGVSRLHATLVRAADGGWAIVDEGSANGTTINAGDDPISPHVEVPLRDGDRVHLGAWTTITLALSAPGRAPS
jgi:rubredoxin